MFGIGFAYSAQRAETMVNMGLQLSGKFMSKKYFFQYKIVNNMIKWDY